MRNQRYSVIRNARVIGGKWARCSKGWTLAADGLDGFAIVDDASPVTAPEAYQSEQDAHNMLKFLRSKSYSRGIIYEDSKEG